MAQSKKQSRFLLPTIIAAVLIAAVGAFALFYFRAHTTSRPRITAKPGTLIETGTAHSAAAASPTAPPPALPPTSEEKPISEEKKPISEEKKSSAVFPRNESNSRVPPPNTSPVSEERKTRDIGRAPATSAGMTRNSPAVHARPTDHVPEIAVTVPATSATPPSKSYKPGSPDNARSVPSANLPEIAVTVAPPVTQPLSAKNDGKALHNGPSSGILRWSGVVEEGGVITIEGDQASSGTVKGALPGLPIQVELVSKHAAISEAPAPSNSWKRVAIRSLKRQTELALRWTVLP